MQSATTGANTQVVLRPTQLVAEALIHGHDREELVSRARSVGLSRDLTETVVTVCCRDRRRVESDTARAKGQRN